MGGLGRGIARQEALSKRCWQQQQKSETDAREGLREQQQTATPCATTGPATKGLRGANTSTPDDIRAPTGRPGAKNAAELRPGS